MKIVIVGAGTVGSFLAQQLSQRSEDVIVIDSDAKALERIEEKTDVMTLQGNGTFRKTLAEVNVQSADLVLGVTSHDDTNLVTTSLASSMGAKRTVSRVDAPEFFMTSSGIEREVLGSFAIVCASRLVSAELLRQVRQVDLPYVENFSANSITVAAVPVTESCRYLEKSASQIDLGKSAKVIGILRDGELRRAVDIANLYSGDRVLIASSLVKLPIAVRRIDQIPGKKAVIIGGGDVGYQLAQSLQEVENRLTVIDIDRRRCEFLADHLDKATVVHGDGTSLPLLQDEHVEMADYLIAVTRADEVNLMSSLVSQEIGVPHSFSLVHRPGYRNVYEHLGVRGTTSAHELISKAVHKYFPGQTLLTESHIPDSDYVVGEFQINPEKKGDAIKLEDLSIPPGCFFVGVSRSEKFYFADGESEIIAGDVLIIIFKKQELKTLETTFRKLK